MRPRMHVLQYRSSPRKIMRAHLHVLCAVGGVDCASEAAVAAEEGVLQEEGAVGQAAGAVHQLPAGCQAHAGRQVSARGHVGGRGHRHASRCIGGRLDPGLADGCRPGHGQRR